MKGSILKDSPEYESYSKNEAKLSLDEMKMLNINLENKSCCKKKVCCKNKSCCKKRI